MEIQAEKQTEAASTTPVLRTLEMFLKEEFTDHETLLQEYDLVWTQLEDSLRSGEIGIDEYWDMYEAARDSFDKKRAAISFNDAYEAKNTQGQAGYGEVSNAKTS